MAALFPSAVLPDGTWQLCTLYAYRKNSSISSDRRNGGRRVILNLAAEFSGEVEAVARMKARLLRGENPVKIPLEVLKLMRLVLDLKEAETMEIMFPPDVVSTSTRLIR